MPRDLESEKATMDGLPTLTREADLSPLHDDEPEPLWRPPKLKPDDEYERLLNIRPYCSMLNQEDVDEIDWLEHAAFDPAEAAAREKIEYRLKVCGDLCAGIYSSAYVTTQGSLGELARSRNFPSVDSKDHDRKRLLLGHIIATKSKGRLVTDTSMGFPSDWRTKYTLSPSKGHDEDGETICLHSLAVHPNFQKKALGRVLLLGWCQRMRDSGLCKRIALIAREKLTPWYQKHGFKLVGPSAVQYGGGGWVDMVLEFNDMPSDDM